MATHPKSNNVVPSGLRSMSLHCRSVCKQHVSYLRAIASCEKLPGGGGGGGGASLTEAAELGFKWPLELHHTQALRHGRLRGHSSAPRQVHVCLFFDLPWHSRAADATPPPPSPVHPTLEDKYLEVKACRTFLLPNIFSWCQSRLQGPRAHK